MRILIFIMVFIVQLNAGTSDTASSYDKNIIVRDQNRNNKIVALFEKLIKHYKSSNYVEFIKEISQDKFIGDYELFTEALDDDMRDYDIHSITYRINSILPSGYKGSVSRILNVTWQKRYTYLGGANLLSEHTSTGTAILQFDEVNGDYKLIRISGDLLFGSSSAELQNDIPKDGSLKTQKPDLEVTNINLTNFNVSSKIQDDEAQSITLTIINNGDALISQAFFISLEFGNDDGDSGYVWVEVDERIPAHESIQIKEDIEIKNYKKFTSVNIFVDNEDVIVESNERNNQKVFNIQLIPDIVKKPNLTIDSTDFLMPNKLDMVVENRGESDVSSFKYIMGVKYIDSYKEDKTFSFTYNHVLKAGESTPEIAHTLDFDSRNGVKEYFMIIDPENDIDESDESDNDTHVNIEPVFMDIIPIELEISDSGITFDVKNQGDYKIGHINYEVTYTVDGEEKSIIYSELEYLVPNPNESISIAQDIDFENTASTSVSVRIYTAVENDEGYPPARENNTITATKTFDRSIDLEIVDIQTPGYLDGECSDVPAQITVKNISAQNVTNTKLEVEYILDTNEADHTTIENISLNPNEVKIIEVPLVVNDGNYMQYTTVKIKATIDPDETITESDEDNNILSKEFKKNNIIKIEDIIVPPYDDHGCQDDEIGVLIKNYGTHRACGINVVLKYSLNNDTDMTESTVEESIDIDANTQESLVGTAHEFCQSSKATLRVVVNPETNPISLAKSVHRDIDLEVVSMDASGLTQGQCNTMKIVLKNNGSNKVYNEDLDILYTINGQDKTYKSQNVTLDAGDEQEFIVTLESDCESSVSTIKVIADNDESAIESDEGNNELIKTVLVDLEVSDLAISPTNISFRVTNTSQYNIPYDIHTAISYVVTYYDDGIATDEQELDHVITSLDAGASVVVNKDIVKRLYLQQIEANVNVDPNNNIQESNEDNNDISKVFNSIKPDLSASKMMIDDITLSFEVTSTESNANASHYTIECMDFSASVSGVIPAIDIDAIEEIVHENISWLRDCASIKVTIDAENEVDESNENNNVLTKTFDIAKPDLVPSDIQKVNSDNVIQFTVSSTNNNSGASHYKVECDNSGGYSITAVPNDSTTGVIPAITINNEIDITTDELSWISGCSNVKVIVDVDNEIDEEDESNNIISKIFPKADLSGSDPVCELVGTSVSVFDFTVHNNFVATTSNTYKISCPSTGDQVTGTIDALGVGEDIVIHHIATSDDWIGTCSDLEIIIDSNNEITESDESNNVINGFSCSGSLPNLSITDPMCIGSTEITFNVHNDDALSAENSYSIACATGGPAPITGIVPALDTDNNALIEYISVPWLMDCMSVIITVDIDNEVTESNENDNSYNYTCE